jgi:hypothetical protein
LFKQIKHNIITTEDLLKEYEDINIMINEHKSNDEEFKQKYQEAFKEYIAGRWPQALKIFEV